MSDPRTEAALAAAAAEDGLGYIRALHEAGSSQDHRDGVPWYEAPVPRRLHRCTAWTMGWLHHFTSVERCACGAIRLNGSGWLERNSRRSS